MSILPVADLKVPGLYFQAARAFGLKGLLGGTHSWLTHIADDLKHTVIEVTTIETLHVQGSSFYKSFRDTPNYLIDPELHQVFVSNRNGSQRWFGHDPKITYLGPMELDVLLSWSELYPHIHDTFRVLTTNCNTFTSWILHLMGVELWAGIGAKTWSKYAK